MRPLPHHRPPPAGAVRLTDWGVIRASGAEALKFLHGQMTQDFEHLQPQHAQLAGYCSPKGRLLASFVAWRGAADEVLLACSADLLAAALKRLSMFVLRAKCRLEDASAELPLWGLAGGAAQDALGAAALAAPWSRGGFEGADVIRLPDAPVQGVPVPRFLCTGTPPQGLPEMPLDTWRWLEVKTGVARIVAATAEQFVPQTVNFELVGGVNFRKGCYPGQEVVSRSQYRGTIKRRGYVFDCAEALQPGQEVFLGTDAEQPAGRVALAGSMGTRHAALVELKIAALQGGALHAGSAQGPRLDLGALPYEIPVAAD